MWTAPSPTLSSQADERLPLLQPPWQTSGSLPGTPPGQGHSSQRSSPLPRSAASGSRGHSVAAPQRAVGGGLGCDPGPWLQAPLAVLQGKLPAAPGPAWSTVFWPWLRLPTLWAAQGPARHAGWGGHMGTRGLGQAARAASGRRSHTAGARSSGSQGYRQRVVVQPRLQEACSRRVLGLGHLPGSVAFGRREPAVRVSVGSA